MTRKRKKRSPLIPAWVASFIILWNDLRKTILLGSASLLWRGLTRFWRLWAAAGVSLLAGMNTNSAEVGWVLFVFMLAGLAYLRLRRPRAGSRWWDQETLSTALVDAGTLKMSGEKLPTLSYKGKPQHGEYGTTVIVGLPQAKGPEDVTSRLAKALQIPAARLSVTQEPTDNANVVRIHVGTTPKKSPPPPVVAVDRTDWSQPFRIGVDERGREVMFTTTETHTVLAGATGSGKSVLAHLVVAHAALDPRVRLFGIDGKGDSGARGWEYLEPICEAFVRGMGADSPARIEALLREVYDLAEDRGRAGHEAPEIVLILEEWAAARAVLQQLDRACADRCDALVTVLMATSRSRGVHILPIVQRGTATSFTTDQRANCGQRIVGKFGDRKEAGYVLEALPSRLPSKAGEFLLSLDGKPPTLVTVDELKPEAWRKVCRRAVALRTPARPALTLAPPPSQPGEGLVSEVVALLADEGELSATELHRRLSPEVREGMTARDLGVTLAQFPHVVTRVKAGNGRVWRLAEGADSSAGVW